VVPARHSAYRRKDQTVSVHAGVAEAKVFLQGQALADHDLWHKTISRDPYCPPKTPPRHPSLLPCKHFTED
ncbi:unnamed protein product, partial [Arctogadus glacialis]